LQKSAIKFQNFIKKYQLVLLILFVTTTFFLIQHFFVLSWDFISYVLNAKNMFNSGLYFETFRPPLTSFIIGLIAQIVGYPIAEVIYIIVVSVLFCISVVLLSKQLNFNAELFYLILVTPFVLHFGLINGTELLSVTLLLLGIYFIIKNNWISGLFIGLSALTRYTGIVFGVILLFHKGINKKIKAIILFCITFVPWFIYNRLKFGNFFTSIADQYHQNIVSRQDMIQIPKLIHFINIQSLLFIFTIIGILYISYKIIKKIKDKYPDIRISIIMFIILGYTTYSYFTTPFKEARYLFAAMLPIGYFTYIGVDLVLHKIKNKKTKFSKYYSQALFWILLILLITVSITLLLITQKETAQFKNNFKEGIDFIYKNHWQDCVMYSENWIYFSYLDENIIMLPIEIYLEDIPKQNNRVLFLYLNSHNPDTREALLKNLNLIATNKNFLVFGNLENCRKKSEYIDLFYIPNSLYTNPCNILFNKIRPVEEICYFINKNS
jgi:hypothetical protein